jgi:hypothetical protein
VPKLPHAEGGSGRRRVAAAAVLLGLALLRVFVCLFVFVFGCRV